MQRKKKRRTPDEHYAAWIAWRKRTALAANPDRCVEHIGEKFPLMKSRPRKCCVQCTGCNALIKKDKIEEHQQSCVAYQRFEVFMENIRPGDEYLERNRAGSVRGVPCGYCGRLVRDRTEEWHWRNGCENSPFNRAVTDQ